MDKFKLVKGKARLDVTEDVLPALPARKVFVGLPAYEGKRCVTSEVSLMFAQQVFWMNRIGYELEYETKCPYVSMARNNIVSKFMEREEFTELLFIDSDVGFPPEAFKGLLDCDVDVAAGVYPKKSDNANDWPVVLKTTPEGLPIVKEGLLLAEGAPTGFMKIKRHVIEKMQQAYPELRYLDGLTGRISYDLFGCGVRYYDPETGIGRWYGDDFGFCDLWERIGGEVWIAPNIDFEHVGAKTYKGNYQTFLLSLPQAEEAAPIQKALHIEGWMSYPELKWLYERSRDMGSVVEIGSFKGRSTAAILAGCQGKVTAVDTWKGDNDGNGTLKVLYELGDIKKEFMKNVGDSPNLEAMEMESLEAAKKVDDADFVFIDGEHTYESVKADILAWLPKTRKLIAGHDYQIGWPEVMRAVNDTLGQVTVVDTIWFKEIPQEVA